MQESRAYVRQRAAGKTPDEKLAINFDIDNTVIATYYDGGGAIPMMLRFSRLLDSLGVALVFNSGRPANQQRRTVDQLTRAGYPVAGVCLRNKGETLPAGKQRCRDGFVAEGYTLIANVGNNDTDFVGDGYERAFVLPNYGGARLALREPRADDPLEPVQVVGEPELGCELADHVDEHLAGLDDPRVHVAETSSATTP